MPKRASSPRPQSSARQTDTPSERLARQFFTGFVRTHVLHHAAHEAVCGVTLTQELARHGYRLSPGTLYPLLHDLAQAGYLRGSTERCEGRRRKCYSITPKGLWVLSKVKAQIKELVSEILENE